MPILALLPLLSLVCVGLLLTLRLPVRLQLVGAAFVVWYVWAAIAGRVLSLGGLVGNQLSWIVVELIPILVVILFRKRIDASLITSQLLPDRAKLLQVCRSIWVLPIMACGVAVLYGVGLVANLVLGQTMDDSLTAYLARAGFAISSGSVERFSTSSYNFALVAYPAMPTFSTARWIVLAGNDHLATMDQWLGVFSASALIYCLSIKLRISKSVALAVTLLWMAMPVIVLQSQMVLNDIVTIVFILTAITYAIEWFAVPSSTSLLIALIAVLAAAGIKQTVLFMLPPFLLVFGCASFHLGFKKNARRLTELVSKIQTWVVLGLVAIAALPEYFLNIRDFGHPLGPSESFDYFTDQSIGILDRFRSIGSSSAQVVYAGLFSDIPRSWANRLLPLYEHVRSVYVNAGNEVDRLFGVGWFGVVPTALLIVGLTAGAAVMRRRKQVFAYLLTVAGTLLYVALFLFVRPNFSVAFSRYMLYPVTLLVLLGGVVLDQAMKSSILWRRNAMQLVMCVVCILTLYQGSWSLCGNGTRPLSGANSAWGKSDSELLINSNGFIDIGASQPIIHDLDHCLPAKATVFIALPFKFPLARLFGPSYTRDVHFLSVPEQTVITLSTMQSLGADAIIIDDVYLERFKIVPDGLYSVSSGQFTLVRTVSDQVGCD